jgi:hypothetical protein
LNTLPFVVAQLLALATGSFAVGWAFRGLPARWLGVVTYGYVAGLVLGAASLYLCGVAGLGIRFWSAAAVQIVLAVALGLLNRYATRRDRDAGPKDVRLPAHGVALLAIVLLLALLIVRAISVGIDAVTLPLYPWDAWQQWGTKARVWFETHELRPFVSPAEWLAESARGVAVYTDANPAYPPLLPLLQVWTLGYSTAWNDAVTGVTWLGLFCAFGAGVAWQVYRVLPYWPYALGTAYLALSLPFLDAHVALAGYGDFPLSVLYCFAFMSAIAFQRFDRAGDAAMALAFVAMLPFFKRPGIAWALTLLPFAAVVLPSARRPLVLRLLVIAATGVVSVLMVFRVSHAAMPTVVESLWSVVLNLFAWENWHLLWYIALLTLATRWRRASWRSLEASAATLMLGGLFLAWAFWGTELYSSIANVTTLNRALLPFACIVCYFIALSMAPAIERLAQGARADETRREEAPVQSHVDVAP